jgi:hypothetical protein
MKKLTGKIVFYRRSYSGAQVNTVPVQLHLLSNFLSSDLRSVPGIDVSLDVMKDYLNGLCEIDSGIAQNTGELILAKDTATFVEDYVKENEEQDFVVETDLLFEIIARWRQFLIDKNIDSIEIDVEELRALVVSRNSK